MRGVFGWIVVWLVALGFAFLVDRGNRHLGIPDYLWLSVNLTLFLYVLQRYVGRPMGAFLETRREGIEAELARAKEQLVEAEELRAESSRRLQEVENEIERLKERAAEEGRAEAERIAEQARQEEERFVRRVEQEISRREAETRAQLAQDTADLTAELAREILEHEMTDEDRRRVFASSLEALRGLEKKEGR